MDMGTARGSPRTPAAHRWPRSFRLWHSLATAIDAESKGQSRPLARRAARSGDRRRGGAVGKENADLTSRHVSGSLRRRGGPFDARATTLVSSTCGSLVVRANLLACAGSCEFVHKLVALRLSHTP